MISPTPNFGTVKIRGSERDFSSGRPGILRPTETEKTLSAAVFDLCCQIVDVEHSGWENNEGGEGSIEIKVDKGTLVLSHAYYTRELDWHESAWGGTTEEAKELA
jgi:hypothetical protein